MKLTIVAALLIVAQSSTSEPPRDFALQIVFGQCWNEAIDTTQATFTRTFSPAESRTVKVSLTAEHRRRLYALAVDADVFGYPRSFEPEGASMVEELPPSDFRIEIRSGGRNHIVEWLDRGSRRPEAVRLRSMLRAVRDLFAERPEVQRMPASRMVCL